MGPVEKAADNASSSSSSLMSDFLSKSGGVAVIDGGLATELERHGADLNDPLWSAKCLLTSPHFIRSVHLDYLEAGADIIITASYQATIQGFRAKGFSQEESEVLLKKSVEIACEARSMYYDRCRDSSTDYTADGKLLKHRPILVAASVGSYGAYLADGSEYSGDYGDAMDLEFLKDFHRRRVQLLADSGPDLIAFETVPNKLEAQAFTELLEEEDINIPSWLSFNSKDGINVVSGDSLSECAAIAESCKKIVAVGINCTPPRFIQDLILSIKKPVALNCTLDDEKLSCWKCWGPDPELFSDELISAQFDVVVDKIRRFKGLYLSVTVKPILIYPNSGESYDADQKEWVQNTGVSDEDFVSYVNKWCEVGASLVGGCCRTTPVTIGAIYRALRYPTPL